MNDPNSLFPKLVQEYRKTKLEQPMSLREFGDAIHYSHAAVAAWERGEYLPSIEMILGRAFLEVGWVSEFYYDALSILLPDLYKPAGEIGKKLLQAEACH